MPFALRWAWINYPKVAQGRELECNSLFTVDCFLALQQQRHRLVKIQRPALLPQISVCR